MDRYNSFASSSETTLVLKFEHIVLDKFKTSILKRDRELKKEFIEKYLFSEQKFCFNLKKVSVLQYPEKTFVELDHQNDQIFILYEGIILRRKSKAGVIIASS